MQINRINLKQARLAKRLSLERLAENAKVDRQTIHRIEAGKASHQRHLTVERLAKALALTVEQLCGPTLDAADFVRPRERQAATSQMNTKMPNSIRNAFTLVSSRYGVKTNQIVQLAPYLFMWAAESSLNKRTRDLEALIEAHEAAQSRVPDHAGWSFMHPGDYEQFAAREARSIDWLDIFARSLVEQVNWDTPVPADNPLARFLQGLAAEMSADCLFEGWDPDFGPEYRICESEVLHLVGDDRQAADYLLNGRVGLHEIPGEVQSSENPQRIAEWIVQVGGEREAEAEAALEAWSAKLDFKQKQIFDDINRAIKNGREKSK